MGFPIGYTLTVILRTPSLVAAPGALRNPDSGNPTVTITKNGSASGLTSPTITSLGTGKYKVQQTFLAAEWAHRASFDLAASWTMEGIALEQSLAQGYVEAEPFLTGTVSDGAPTGAGFTAAAGLSGDDDEYVGMLVVFTSGPAHGIPRKVTGYTGATRAFAFSTPFPETPQNGDEFWIIGRAT